MINLNAIRKEFTRRLCGGIYDIRNTIYEERKGDALLVNKVYA